MYELRAEAGNVTGAMKTERWAVVKTTGMTEVLAPARRRHVPNARHIQLLSHRMCGGDMGRIVE